MRKMVKAPFGNTTEKHCNFVFLVYLREALKGFELNLSSHLEGVVRTK